MRFAELLLERYLDVRDALRPYVDKPNVYMSYTADVGALSHGEESGARNASGAKLGIFPRSTYDTPLAIYSYPLNNEMFEHVLHNSVPFAAERPFIQVFEATGTIIDLNTMSTSDYHAYSEKLEQMFSRDMPIQYVMNPDYDPEDDNSYPRIDRPVPWPEFQKEVERDALVHSPGGYFWALTRACSMLPHKGRKPPVVWNGIFRALGVDGCSDNEGRGIIHHLEPMQACFFSMRGVRLLETVRNVRKATYDDGDIKTFHTFAQLFDEINWLDEMPKSHFKRLIAQSAHLLTSGRSQNYMLGPAFWESSSKSHGGFYSREDAERVIAFFLENGTDPTILLAKCAEVPGLRTPEMADLFINSLTWRSPKNGAKGSGLLALTRPTNIKHVATLRGEDIEGTQQWLYGKIALGLLRHDFFISSQTPDEEVAREALDVLTKRVGEAKAHRIVRALGHDSFVKIARQAGEDDIPF